MDIPASPSRRRVLCGLGAGAFLLASLTSQPIKAKDSPMLSTFITGSTDVLGRAAAETLIAEGHQVVLHARSHERAKALSDLAPKSAGGVVGDLASAAQ